mmetsp:Transcript_40439/g.53234  ORF Transcript_40439/g.53234 Transcript_40439/m.53234 type:complete len:143 (+) Transcript_40439:1-429(+)
MIPSLEFGEDGSTEAFPSPQGAGLFEMLGPFEWKELSTTPEWACHLALRTCVGVVSPKIFRGDFCLTAQAETIGYRTLIAYLAVCHPNLLGHEGVAGGAGAEVTVGFDVAVPMGHRDTDTALVAHLATEQASAEMPRLGALP